MYRDSAGCAFSTKDVSYLVSDNDIVYKYNLVNPMTLIRRGRLSLLARVLRKSPPHIIELATRTASFISGWAYAVSADCMWLDGCGGFGGAFKYQLDFSQWVTELGHDPVGFNKKVSRFCASPYANVSTHRVDQLAPAVAGVSPLRCHVCGQPENSEQQLRLHLFKRHHIKDSIHRYADTTQCTICLKEFHHRENLINHLKKVYFCFHQS